MTEKNWLTQSCSSLWTAIAFYTIIPIPRFIVIDFHRVARWATLMGLFIGSLLSLLDHILSSIHIPMLTRSGLVVLIWIGITGGLHLDGAMDTADGLGVSNPEKRLEVMSDSRSGAFGVIIAIAIILLKVVALSDLGNGRDISLILASMWGRWGQVVAIAFYPYLKPTGKGAFHKTNFKFPEDLIPSLLFFVGVYGWQIYQGTSWWEIAVSSLGGMAIALISSYYFHFRLGGHTGDTYGATVEWTEVLYLCLMLVH